MMEDTSDPGNPVITYPATRRRFTSTQRRPVEPSFDQAHSSQLTLFPTIPTVHHKKISPPEHGILRSRSQDRNSKMLPLTALKSNASDISNGEPQQPVIMQRLDDIEARQAKIESLLTQIWQNISSDK
jgi:hypothetical protein